MVVHLRRLSTVVHLLATTIHIPPTCKIKYTHPPPRVPKISSNMILAQNFHLNQVHKGSLICLGINVGLFLPV